MIDSQFGSVLSGAAGALLLISAMLRLVQDVPFFQAAGPLSDPVAAALVVVEAVPIGAGLLLGLCAVLIAWLTWTNKLRNGTAIGIVFALVLVGGLLLAVRGYPPAEQVGWALVFLSAATLVAYFWVREPTRER
jgi:hypothetical protein